MKFAWHCTCGGSMTGQAPDADVKRIQLIWNAHHSGDGHALTDSKTASRTRSKKDAAVVEARRREYLRVKYMKEPTNE
jgi:hypothetical protein